MLMACCGLIMLSGQAATAASGGKTVSKSPALPKEVASGRPMSAVELRRLYSGKTWLWESGGGYMDPSGRFDAIAGSDRARTTLTNGRWSTGNKGRMCFQGTWKAKAGNGRSETCFTHYISGDSIYQRREPGGAWYAFKRSPAEEADEFNKVVDGNRIAAQIRPQQAAPAPSRRKRK
jgi:hypothetical protein